MRTNDLVNAVRMFYCPAFSGSLLRVFQQHTVAEIMQPPSDHQRPPTAASRAAANGLLVGDSYYERKQELIHDEQVLLRAMHFQIATEHPYKYLYCFVRTLNLELLAVRAATCLVNDSLVYTDLCLTHSPGEVAAAAIKTVATHIVNVQLPSTREVHWTHALGLERKRVAAAADQLWAMLERETRGGGSGRSRGS